MGKKDVKRRPETKPTPPLDSLSRSQNLLVKLAVIIAVAVPWFVWQGYRGPSGPPEIIPLAVPKLKDLDEFDGQYKSSMFWGSYRAGLYFGMKTRSPAPLMTGLMWCDPSAIETIYQNQLRHEASQDDRLAGYGWLRHDGRSFGEQEIIDNDYNLTIHMLKQAGPGSGFGGDWAVRLSARKSKSLKEAEEASGHPKKRPMSLLFYIADGAWQQGDLRVLPEGPATKVGQGVKLVSSAGHDEVGPWSLSLVPGPTWPKRSTAADLHHLGIRLQEEGQLTQLRSSLIMAMGQAAEKERQTQDRLKLHLPNIVQPGSNLVVLQLSFLLPASFDLVFMSGQGAQGPGGVERLKQLSGDSLTGLLEEHASAFDSRFEATFGPATTPDTPGPTPSDLLPVSKAALSNLVGSMGFFYGASRVKLPPAALKALPRDKQPSRDPRKAAAAAGDDPAVVENWLEVLFTATPSRSFFPRGFLWDEGFHQLLLQKWDGPLSRDALAHWLDLMNAQGWIPREQILGAEARSRVPPEYIIQYPDHANPPSLFLPLMKMAQEAAAAATEGGGGPAGVEAARKVEFLTRAWPRLEAWYKWFNTTQAGPMPGSYRWKGRNSTTDRELNPKTLTSGLDDYPRASHPSPEERHVDMLSWMALASSAMALIGSMAGKPVEVTSQYAAAAASLGSLDHLKSLHLDPKTQAFLDWGLHTEAVELQPPPLPEPEPQQQQQQSSPDYLVRVVSEPPQLQFVPSFGYVSLFPLMMKLLPADSEELGQQLELLRREELLWSSYGLRSLATTSSIYMKRNTKHDPPYWRGQIWIPMNFLVLRALHLYGATSGPHQDRARELHQELRRNLLANLESNYRSTGYLWEQYRDSDGQGISSHPFTGWTALLTLIAAEAY